MPIECAIEIQPIETRDFREIDYSIMGQFYQIQNEMGRLAHQFVNAPIPRTERTLFNLELRGLTHSSPAVQLMVPLLRDRGTSLTARLYLQAATHLLGGKERAERKAPIRRTGHPPFASQTFLLLDDETAIECTAFNVPEESHKKNMERLISLTPLRAVHWVNIGNHTVTFTNIESVKR